MLRAIRFIKDYRCFRAGDYFTLRADIPNLLVGDQGSGKSTLLHLIRNWKPDDTTIDLDCGAIRVSFLSSEFDNPRLQEDLPTASTVLDSEELYESHGQTMRSLLDSMLRRSRNTLFLLDKPETALSVHSCRRLAALMKRTITHGCQVVAATHSPPIIQAVPQVLCLDRRTWVDSAEYLGGQELAEWADSTVGDTPA